MDLQPPTAACPAWPNAFVDGVDGLQGNPERTPPTVLCTTDADCGDPGQLVCNAVTAQCVCLHNGWMRRTEDDSSHVTGSSVFDFNGDGAAEVVYNDECFFRIYDGRDGTVLFKEHSPSRTRTEYPVIADVDNDGNAEIVFAASNESGFCSEGNDYNNGIEVWGDASDTWVSARRIWNQHAYHVTNVLEGGGIPVREPESWLPRAGRLYNTYRSNPRSYGVAPDLAMTGLQVSSPDAACGELTSIVDITVRVENRGDLRVGPGIVAGFHGEWVAPPIIEPLYADALMTPLVATIGTSLEPGFSILLTVRYEAAHNAAGVLPDLITAVVDELEAARECDEDNNALTVPVEGGDPVADLVIALGEVAETCPDVAVETTVTNIGSAPASGVVVRYYAGNPAAGGIPIHDVLVPGPIPPWGGSVTFVATLLDVPRRPFRLYAVVDPDDEVEECNDGNNTALAEQPVDCPPDLV